MSWGAASSHQVYFLDSHSFINYVRVYGLASDLMIRLVMTGGRLLRWVGFIHHTESGSVGVFSDVTVPYILESNPH